MMKIYIEQHPNTEVKTFHTSRNFAQKHQLCVCGSNYGADYQTTEVVNLWERLIALVEVQEVSIHKNNLRIKRNLCFEWAEIQPIVIPHLQAFFGEDDVEVTVQPREPWMDEPVRDNDF